MDVGLLEQRLVDRRNRMRVALVCMETSHNNAGGTVPSLEHMAQVMALVHANGARVHIDGARLFNAAIALGCTPAAIGAYASTPHRFRGHDLGEVVYWCLLGFYGMVFPAYLLVHGLTGRPGPVATRRSLFTAMVFIAVAFPMYWMGFIEKKPIWLVPGVLVVLASRLISRRLFHREPGPRPNGLRFGSRGTP